MPEMGCVQVAFNVLPPALAASGAPGAVKDGKLQRNIKLADPSVAHAWKKGIAPLTAKAPPRAPATLGTRQVDAPVDGPVPSEGAIQADAMPKAAEAAEKASARKNDTFGLDRWLRADLVDGTKRFLRHYHHAKKLEHAAKYSKHYKAVETTRLRDDGSIDKEDRWVRTEPSGAQRILARSEKDGLRVKQGYNHLNDWLREKAGRPRKTGLNYGSKKGSGCLLASATGVPADGVGGATTVGKAGASAVRAGVMNEQPGLVPSVSAFGDTMSDVGLTSTVYDAMDATVGWLGISSRETTDKANLVGGLYDSARFRRLLGEATPEESKTYLDFDTSADRLINPTKEQKATDAHTRDYFIKSAGLNPLSSGVSVGTQVAGYVGPVSAGAGLVAAPLGLGAACLDLSQAKGEWERRVEQAATASARKTVLQKMSQRFAHLPGADVRRGVMASLWMQQHRLERQARYEKGFAGVRAFKAMTNVLGNLTGIGFVCAALAGVTTLAVAAPVMAALAVPVAFGGGVIAGRSYLRRRAEHSSKWRERAVAAAIQTMTRQGLEELLSRPPEEPAEVTVTIGRGEYLVDQDRFAGERTVTFDVRENEYVGLHMFALQIQDLMRNRDAEAAEPWIETLKGLGVDAVRLLAICKAASAKPENQQLDFIKSYLAPALGMKYRMSGPKILPSVFLGRFQNALRDAGIGKKTPPSPSAYRRVRDDLVKQLADGEAAMAAFKATTSEFLGKTGKLPPSPLRSHLRAFLELDQLTAASGTALPEIGADEVIEFFRNAPDNGDFDAHIHKNLTKNGFRQEEMATAIHLGAAGLTNLPAAEAARIQAQMNAFILRLERT